MHLQFFDLHIFFAVTSSYLCYLIYVLNRSLLFRCCLRAGGRHAMALTVDGKVFSWGEGDDGKLGHYSRTYVTDCKSTVLQIELN